MTKLARLCVLALALTTLAVVARAQDPQPAPAADPHAESDALREKGNALMVDLKYGEALAAYDEAYRLYPNPAIHYNRGRALQALGRLPEALDALEAFDRDAPQDLKARVPLLASLLEEVRHSVGTLRIETMPPGARAIVRGEVRGVTPLVVRLNAGDATIELTLERYKPTKKSLRVEGGTEQSVTVKLEPRSNRGTLIVGSPVAGAQVEVDGEAIGAVPAEVSLPAGEHAVLVTSDGYEDASTTAVVEAGATKRVDVPLEETPAVYERWWFWTTAGVIVTGAVIITAVALTESSPGEGTIPPGKVSAPIITF
jgi:PEGA domain-containing protein